MKKIFLFPIWKVDKIEEALSIMEQDGWRLAKLSAFNCFHFVKSSPKKSTYFFTYKLLKETGMAETEQFLRSKFNADPIIGTPVVSILNTVRVYRIAHSANLEKSRFYRNIYLQHLVCQKLLLALLIPILSILCLILQLVFSEITAVQMPQWIFLAAISFLCLIYCGWNLYGLLLLKHQYKETLPHITISYEDLSEVR